MRWYWGKIAIGALLIFCVGYGGLLAFRSAKTNVVRVVHTNSDLTIPLPFVPFVVDGIEAGKFRRLVLHRSDAEHLSGIDLSVRVGDAAALAGLSESCQLTVEDPKRLGSKTSFHCVESSDGMRPFGEIAVQTRDADGDWATTRTIQFVLPEHVVLDLEGADIAANAAGAEADEIRALADQIGAISAKLATATASERDVLRRELRDLRAEMRDVEMAAAQVSRSTRRVRVKAPTVKVEVDVGDPPGAAPSRPEGHR
jgi:hypothetical protein